MSTRFRLTRVETQNVLGWLKEFFESRALPADALREGSGRILYLLHQVWRVGGDVRDFSVRNLAEQTRIKSLENKMKGRTPVNVCEVRELLVCMFCSWHLINGKFVCYGGFSEEVVKSVAEMLTRTLMGDTATLVITKESPAWLFGGREPSYILKERIFLADLLQALAMRTVLRILLEDKVGFEVSMSIVPIMIEGQESLKKRGRVAEPGLLYVTAIPEGGSDYGAIIISCRDWVV